MGYARRDRCQQPTRGTRRRVTRAPEAGARSSEGDFIVALLAACGSDNPLGMGKGRTRSPGGHRTDADPDAGRAVANLVYPVKVFVAARPAFAVATAKVRRPNLALQRDTDVVVEGFPKSANSFVTHAFRMPQGRPLQITHHTHAAGVVIAACRKGVPALVLIRQPVDAVSRIALVRPHISLRLLLRGWISFYRPLLPWRGRFAVASFEEVTTDLGAVMTEMNERLGTRFVPFEHTPENEQEAFRALEDDWATRIDPTELGHELNVGRPSHNRDAMTEDILAKLRSVSYDPLRARASSLYDQIAEG